MKNKQQLATNVFITASVLFGITGITMVLSTGPGNEPAELFGKLLALWGFTVLSSFGVSVGLKYLSNK